MAFRVLQEALQTKPGAVWDGSQYRTIWPNSFDAPEFQIKTVSNNPLVTAVFNQSRQFLTIRVEEQLKFPGGVSVEGDG
eukprot:3516038-Prorocentrum_lima.AAC.1